MQLSHRIKAITKDGSDGWDVYYKAQALKASGADICDLSIGEPDVKTDPAILQAMHKSAASGNTGYGLVPGQTNLRKAIAARVQTRTGVATNWRNVLITPGGQAALFCAHMATLNPGDTALYCDPYYVTYPGILRALQATPVAVPTHPAQNFEPQFDDLDAAARSARTLLVNSPNNPTGMIYGRKTLEAIARVCHAHDLWLISDEVYDTQVWQGEHRSPRAFSDMIERTLVVGSMSKSHAMTGSRIGWLVGPEAAIARAADLATVMTFGVPGFIQDAALFALARGAALEEKNAAPFLRRRDLALAVLRQNNALRVIPAMGAMYLMVDVRATGLSGEDFAHALLAQAHIAVMPGESFGNCAAGHIRVALTEKDARLIKALQTLAEFAQSTIG